MGQHRKPVGFGVYLRDAIHASGFMTPTQFARTVGTDPSVVLRWISEDQRPTIRSIERIAPVLGRTINEMIDAAYPDRLGDQSPTAAPHPLAHELGRILADDSHLSAGDRQALVNVIDRTLAPYRGDASATDTRAPGGAGQPGHAQAQARSTA